MRLRNQNALMKRIAGLQEVIGHRGKKLSESCAPGKIKNSNGL
jgi:hypothetical protein